MIGGPDARMVGSPECSGVAAVQHGPAPVAEVAHGGDAGREVPAQRVVDHAGEVLVVERRQAFQRARAGVTAQVHVRIDQTGQDRGIGEVGHRPAVG